VVTLARVTTAPRSVSAPRTPVRAGLGRRIVALLLDWAIASLISAGFFGYDAMATLAVFAAMTALLVGTLGATIGHRACGIAVRAQDGGAPGPLRGLVRTLGLCLVIPAVVWGPDGRGLHDRWAGTDIVRSAPR
jgi:uncharacterized RDD family membrane protein YckC